MKRVLLCLLLFVFAGCSGLRGEGFLVSNEEWNFQFELMEKVRLLDQVEFEGDGFWQYVQDDCIEDCLQFIVSFETMAGISSFDEYKDFMEENLLDSLIVGNSFQVLTPNDLDELRMEYSDNFQLDVVDLSGREVLKHTRNFAPEGLETNVLYWWYDNKSWSILGTFSGAELDEIISNFVFK